MALAVGPLALVRVARRPRVHAAKLEAALPAASELAEALRPAAHADAVRAPLVPVAEIHAAVVELKTAPVGAHWDSLMSDDYSVVRGAGCCLEVNDEMNGFDRWGTDPKTIGRGRDDNTDERVILGRERLLKVSKGANQTAG